MAQPAIDISKLSPGEKLDLIDELWTSLGSDNLTLNPEQMLELDRRLEVLDREGPRGISWDEVRAKMTAGRP